MNGNKRQYDLICSLGGNCAAAHNLQYKGLRPFSLPFDWVYMLNEEPLYKLADCFKDDFSRFFLQENLKPCLLNKKLYPRNYKILKKLAVFLIPYKPLRKN